jgi:hypothetical protein
MLAISRGCFSSDASMQRPASLPFLITPLITSTHRPRYLPPSTWRCRLHAPARSRACCLLPPQLQHTLDLDLFNHICSPIAPTQPSYNTDTVSLCQTLRQAPAACSRQALPRRCSAGWTPCLSLCPGGHAAPGPAAPPPAAAADRKGERRQVRQQKGRQQGQQKGWRYGEAAAAGGQGWTRGEASDAAGGLKVWVGSSSRSGRRFRRERLNSSNRRSEGSNSRKVHTAAAGQRWGEQSDKGNYRLTTTAAVWEQDMGSRAKETAAGTCQLEQHNSRPLPHPCSSQACCNYCSLLSAAACCCTWVLGNTLSSCQPLPLSLQ